MADLKKVIKGLECCLTDDEGYYLCEKCPYAATDDDRTHVDWSCHKTELRMDALELLKAQEPRVMTLEEVKDMNWDYCYLEYDAVRGKEEQIFIGGRHRIACVTWPTITAMRISPGDNEYGKRWRCWTQRPTDEQRKAVKWE